MIQNFNWCSSEDVNKDARLIMLYKTANEKVAIVEKYRLSKSPLKQSRTYIPRPPCKTQQR